MATKKKTAKKASKKAAKKTAATNGKDRSMSKVPVAERRIAFLKMLKKTKATSGASAKSVADLAKRLGYTTHDVYCLGFHQYKLAIEGLVKSVKHEGDSALCFYITAKGLKSL